MMIQRYFMNFAFNFDVEEEDSYLDKEYISNSYIHEEDVLNYGEISCDEAVEELRDRQRTEASAFIDIHIHGDWIVHIRDTSEIDYVNDAGRVCDILPRRYEGGLKLWECSLDLAEFLIDEASNGRLSSGASILELGCGHAVPSIVAVKLGFREIWCCDYNRDVLVNVTWPNIQYNSPRDRLSSVRCSYGDWMGLSAELQRLQHSPFDVIVAAETLYNEETTFKTCWMIQHHLSYDGSAIIATKRHYFGVGGGRGLIERFVEQSKSFSLTIECVKSFEDGSSNIRDILIVRKR